MTARPGPVAVVDLEATCSNTGAGDHTIPAEAMETIEIGAVMVAGDDLGAIDTFQAFIRPVVHPELTAFCRELTGITQEMVDAAEPFEAVFPRFCEWLAGHEAVAWGSWGNYDAYQLRVDAQRHARTGDLARLPPHVNVKKWWASQRPTKRCGLARAVEQAGLTWQGRQHRGIDDARMIARLLPLVGWPEEPQGVALAGDDL